MAITRSQLVKELEPGLNALFGLEYKRYENEHEDIFEIEASERAFEEEVMLTGFASAPTKAEGAGVSYDQANESFTARYTHVTVALAFSITEEAIEDNLYDRLASRYTKALARSMAHTKQVNGAAILNNAFDSNYPGGDGVQLCYNAHPTALGPTFSNTPAVTADLNETSLEQGIIDIAGFTDERGLKIAVMATKLVVPKENQFTSERLMKSTLRTASADNDINAIKSMGLIPEGYVVNHYLTDTDSWYLLTDAPNGLKMFQRAPIRTAFEGDFDTGNVRYKARERYSFGWSDPRGIYGSAGAP
jgi:hypothetical protein